MSIVWADDRSQSSTQSLPFSFIAAAFTLSRLPDDPAHPACEFYLCNYGDPSFPGLSAFLHSSKNCVSFSWQGSFYRLFQLSSPQRFSFSRHSSPSGWFASLILYLESTGCEIPLAADPSFVFPKSPRPVGPASPPPPVVVSNRFAALSSAAVDTPLPDSSPPPSTMDFKSKVPPITFRLTDAVLPLLKPLLLADSRLIYRSSRVTVRPTSLAEYKAILSAAATHHLEFYTHNPVVSHAAKSVLRGLPADTSSDDILRELTSRDLPVSAIRQMWRTEVDGAGVRSKRLLPLWVLTHHQDLLAPLRAVTGLFHFRVTFEAPKSKDTISQCFRCQDFGHHAAFCKFSVRCNICAEGHDSRQCPSRALPSRKCSNCSGDHPASSRDCPSRQRFAASLRRSSSSVPPPVSSAFPPLPRVLPSAPASATSSLLDLLRLLSSPEASRLLSLLTDLLRLLLSSPHLVSNLTSLLSVLASSGLVPVVPP